MWFAKVRKFAKFTMIPILVVLCTLQQHALRLLAVAFIGTLAFLLWKERLPLFEAGSLSLCATAIVAWAYKRYFTRIAVIDRFGQTYSLTTARTLLIRAFMRWVRLAKLRRETNRTLA